MNNFTKSSGRAYWHSITNLFCCSPHIKRLQDKSMKAVMLFMFFALGSGAMFAQNPNLGGGILAGTIDGCMADVPAATPVADLMADPFFDACRASSEAFLLEPNTDFNTPGEYGVSSGYTVGSTNCSWTFYYVYTLKCAGEIEPYTVQYNGGDATQPKLKKGAVIPPGAKDLNLCYADIPAPHTVEYIASLFQDNCSHIKADELVTLRTKSKQDDCKWIVMYVYTIHDGCTEPIEVVITYTGGDTQKPWFTSELPKKDITVDCDNIPAPVTLYWADNCAAPGKVKSVDDTSKLDDRGCAGGVIFRTWSIVDNCGNSDSYTQTINVNETPQAYFDYTQDIYVPCADKANVASYIPDLYYSNGRDSDRCGIYGYAKPNYTPIAESCGSFEVTYTFTDDCDRTSNASLTVYIVDEINPSILLAADDMTVECDGDGNVEQYAAWLANNGGATASDNCDTDLTWTNDDASHPFSDDCGATGQKTIVFTVSDDCGNQSKTFATFYIVDTTDPYGKPAQDLRVQCDGEGNTNQYEVWLANHGGATADDDCSGVTWSHDGPVLKHYKDQYGKDVWENLTDYPNDFTGGCSTFTGEVTVTFRATDDCGNYTESTAVFGIEDSIAPVITDASDMTVECDGSLPGGEPYGTNNVAAYLNWLSNHGGAVASPDACSNISWKYDAYKYGNACDTYYYVTFTASDECGNSTSTSASFHVVDTNSPAIGQEAQDKIVECNGGFDTLIDEASAQGGSNMYQFYYWLANNGGATAMDLCDKDLTWSNDYDGKSFTDECGNTGRITVLFTVTDDCGLSSTTAAEFIIVDTTAPTFTAPKDTTIYKDATCSYDARPVTTGDVYDESDNCNVYPLQATYTDKLSDYDCPGSSLITRTWSLMDECGNKADDQVQYIYIIDNSAPVLTGTLPPSMSNLDLCEAPVGPSEADVAAAYTDNCSNVVVVKTTNTVQVGECGWATQFSYTIADECGNALDPIKILYWGSDQSAPELAPGNVLPKDDYSFTSCSEEALYGAGAGATVDEVFKLFTDNCDLKVDVYKDGPYYTKEGCDWAYYFKFTVTDNCDNSYSFNQNFSGSDKTAPQLVGTIPLDVSGINECFDQALQGTAAGPTTSEIAALYEECSGYGTVYVDKVTNSFGTDCNWIISHEYTIYDGCGNFATPVKITYSGSDQTAPVWLEDYIGKGVALYTGTDETPNAWYTQGGADCPSSATISLKVGDMLNINSSFYVAGVLRGFDSDAIENETGGIFLSDNCTARNDIAIKVTSVTKIGDGCSAEIKVVFVALDACNNESSTWTKTFYIYDNTAPTGTAPADVVVECQSDVPAANIKDVIDPKDNCNTVTVTHEGDVTDGGFPIEFITRTYRITDACGNYTDVTQQIKVEDTTAPEITCSGDISVNSNGTGNVVYDPATMVSYNGKFYILDGTNGVAPAGFELAPQSVLTFIAADFVGKTYFSTISSNCCIVHANQTVEHQDWGFPFSQCNQAGPFAVAPTLGGANCNNSSNHTANQLSLFQTIGNVVNYDAPIFSDNCDPSPTLELTAGLPSGSDFPIGDTTVTYLVTDASGNTATCSFVVTVVDTVPVAPAQAAADSGDVTLDFRAYPVPFNKDVNILYNFKFDTDVAIEVYDTKGLLVLRKDVKGYRSGSDMTLPLSIIGSDQLYYVKLITNRGTVIKKIVSSNVNKR
jgi:HYR domain